MTSFLECLRIVMVLSPLPLAGCIPRYSPPHGYENLSEFDIILPAENRFLGAGEGALVPKSVFM